MLITCLTCSSKSKPIKKAAKKGGNSADLDLFKTDLAEDDIAALQADQEVKAEQERLAKKIEQRKHEMDKRNVKMERVLNRTGNAKSMVFETMDKQRFMIMNRTTLEKVEAPQDSVLDFVMQTRNRVKR